MAKYVNDTCKDAGLEAIADSGNELHLVSQAPAVYADVATYTLGNVALTLGVGNGDYALDDGEVSGRKLTLAAQSVLGTDDGVATHAVIIDTGGAEIKQYTTVPNYAIQNGVTQAVPGFDVWEIQDPT